jgi:hypothetical protein
LFGLNFTSKLFAQALNKITILSTLPILQRSAKGFVPIDREVSDYKKKCVNCTSAFTKFNPNKTKYLFIFNHISGENIRETYNEHKHLVITLSANYKR